MDEAPAFISNADMQKRFAGGPELSRQWVLVLLGDQIYKHEADGWRRLDDRVYSSVEEMMINAVEP